MQKGAAVMNYAVIFAGGIGSRMNSSIPKQFMHVHGKPVIIHTIEQFQNHPLINAISVVCLESRIDELRSLAADYGLDKVKYIVPGAQTGQQSIYNGLKTVSTAHEKDIVLVNDGVRPFVSREIITRCIDCVKQYGSAVTVAPVPDTIGIIDDEEGCRVSMIPDRKKCYALKAPQGFFLGELITAHLKAMSEERYCFTNSAELFMHYGRKIYTVADEGVNFKITTPADLELMKVLLPSWSIEQEKLS